MSAFEKIEWETSDFKNTGKIVQKTRNSRGMSGKHRKKTRGNSSSYEEQLLEFVLVKTNTFGAPGTSLRSCEDNNFVRVKTTTRVLKITGLFCRISSLL